MRVSVSPYSKRFISALRREAIRRAIQHGSRLGGRGLLEYRAVSIEPRFVSSADGSARVRLGDTEVVAGVKFGVGEEFPEGGPPLIVHSEILPHASPYSEPGPPDEVAIELARVVDRGLRHSRFVDWSALRIGDGWTLIAYVDIYVINDGGNLVDAAYLAADAALATAALPGARLGEKGVEMDRSVRRPLPVDVSQAPIAVSVGRVGRTLIVDPSFEEELALDARVTAVYAGDKVVAVQKTIGALGVSEIRQVLDIGLSASRQLREELVKAITPPA